MNQIKIMDQALSNLIAAGEVVERPASVIKELMENALDAHATYIKVEVKGFGLEQIIVTDNGIGMDKENMKLAILPHATSKIYTKDDLLSVKTLGFRGEALPSIASVSKLTIQSRTKDSEGYFIKTVYSKVDDEGFIGMNVGTKVIVEELFFNVPARFKYMKSEYQEKNFIIATFEKIALSYPNVKFELIMDDKVVKSTLGNGSIKALIENIYGRKYSEDLKEIHQTIGKIHAHAYLLSPRFSKPKRNDVNIFINHRYVRNYVLEQAIIESYNTLVMTQKYPIALLYLDLDPTLVDANVHPQKMEVKLVNEMMIAFQLKPFLTDALRSHSYKIVEPLKEIKNETYQVQSLDFVFEESKLLKDNLEEVFKEESKILMDKIPYFEYIGTLLGTYLLFQNDEGLFLIDQHAAEERIRYEYYEIKVGQLKSDSYELIIPLDLALDIKDLEIIKHYRDLLKSYGFEFRDSHLIKHPVWLREKEVEMAVKDILKQLDDEHDIKLDVLRNHLAKDISCKGAIKANHQLSKIEIDELIKKLRKCQNPYTCPHGRPVLIKITQYEIERMFKRIV